MTNKPIPSGKGKKKTNNDLQKYCTDILRLKQHEHHKNSEINWGDPEV